MENNDGTKNELKLNYIQIENQDIILKKAH